MWRVDGPNLRPNKCALTARGEDDVWFDTGLEIRDLDPHVYVSGAGCRLAADAIGFVDPAPLEARIAVLERELADRELQLREADKVIDAIDVFESRGFTARKKTGRPSSKQAA